MVGDAYNMRHPLTGGGMTVAFNDAVILSSMLAPGGRLGLGEGREGLEDWDTVADGLREWFWERKHLAGVVNVLSMALYDLFGGADRESRSIISTQSCHRFTPKHFATKIAGLTRTSRSRIRYTSGWMLQVSRTRRIIRRGSCWTPISHHSTTVLALLPFLRSGFLLDLCPVDAGPDRQGWNLRVRENREC